MTSLLLSRSSEDVRDQLPRVDDSVVLCPLSRRQHFMYSDYLANRFCFVVLTVSLFSTLNNGSNKNVHCQLIVIGCCGICVVDKVITMMNMHVPGMMRTCWSSPNCVTVCIKFKSCVAAHSAVWEIWWWITWLQVDTCQLLVVLLLFWCDHILVPSINVEFLFTRKPWKLKLACSCLAVDKVLWVSFGGLILLVRWQERHLTKKIKPSKET